MMIEPQHRNDYVLDTRWFVYDIPVRKQTQLVVCLLQHIQNRRAVSCKEAAKRRQSKMGGGSEKLSALAEHLITTSFAGYFPYIYFQIINYLEIYIRKVPTMITPEVAQNISQFKGWNLSLNGLTSTTPGVAKNLVQFKGEFLYLNGLTSIRAEVAKNLAQFKGEYFTLNGLLVQFKGE